MLDTRPWLGLAAGVSGGTQSAPVQYSLSSCTLAPLLTPSHVKCETRETVRISEHQALDTHLDTSIVISDQSEQMMSPEL